MRKTLIRLREELLKPDCDIVSALRMAHSIAKHNGSIEFDNWIQSELNGYKCSIQELPDYRKLRGNINALNPFLGKWTPYVIEDKDLEEMLSTAPMLEPISAITQLCKNSKGDIYTFRYRGDVHRKLEQDAGFPEGLDIQLLVNMGKIYAIEESVKNHLLEWVLDNNEEIEIANNKLEKNNQSINKQYSKAFIVHGHDGGLRESVARLLEKQDIKPIILFEQPNQGATIIEKFEKNSDVSAAICLFTADDLGKSKNEEQMRFRARQNVVFESGFLSGN